MGRKITVEFGLILATILGVLLIAAPRPNAVAAGAPASVEVGDVTFPRHIELADNNLELVGAGILRWRLLFRAYASAFYLPTGMPAERWSEDIAKCLTIHYYWNIAGNRFGPAGESVLQRMYTPEELTNIRPQLDALNSAYIDIEKGDRYSLVYSPQKGTTLLHNGQPLVTLPGKEFARLYFSVWLGTSPVDDTLRDKLLGRT